MSAEIIHLPARAPAHGIHPDDGWKAEARRQIGIWRALAMTFRREATTLVAKADKHDHDANELEAKVKAAEYVAANESDDNPKNGGDHARNAYAAEGEPDCGEQGTVGAVEAHGGRAREAEEPDGHRAAGASGGRGRVEAAAPGVDHAGHPTEAHSGASPSPVCLAAAGSGALPDSPTIQGQRTADPSDGEPIELAGVGRVSALPSPTNSLSPLSSEPGSSLPDSAPAFPYTCSGGCGARVERESYVCLECKRRPKCETCNDTGVYSAPEDMGRGSDVTLSACPKCTPRPGTCTFVLNDGSLCGSNPHEGTNRCPFHTFFGHTPTGAIVATAIPALDPTHLLTNSHAKCARRCYRERRLTYDLGYRGAKESEAARFGDMVHKGLEAWFSALTEEDRIISALAAINGFPEDKADPFDKARARAMLMGYHLRWISEPYEVLAVEKEFKGAPLVNPDTGLAHPTWTLGGKIDVILRYLRDGSKYVMDHKTSSEAVGPGSRYLLRLRMDTQVSTYHIGAKHLGHDIAGWIHDILVKPGQRPLKATPAESQKRKKDGTLYANQRETDETPAEYEARIIDAITAAPEEFYSRATIVRLDSEMAEHQRDVWSQVEMIDEARRANRHPKNPDACERYGSSCVFFPVCTGEASLDDDTRYRKVDWTHPELTPAASPAKEER